MMRKGEFQ